MTFKINQRVKWVGPGGEAFGVVTGSLTSQSGIQFVLVRWDGDKGSLQYAKLTAEKYLECMHEYQEVPATPFVECGYCMETR